MLQASAGRRVVAKVPIIFDRPPVETFFARAFLPIIVDHAIVDDRLKLHVLYLDVTSVTTKSDDGGHFVCRIDPESSALPGFVKREPSAPILVFLAHNNLDKPLVEIVYDRLKNLGITPWMDKHDIGWGDDYIDAIEKAIPKTDAAFVFFGRNGMGKMQDMELVAIVEMLRRRQVPVVCILLPGVTEVPPEHLFLSTKNPAPFQALIDDEDDTMLRRFFREKFPERAPL